MSVYMQFISKESIVSVLSSLLWLLSGYCRFPQNPFHSACTYTAQKQSVRNQAEDAKKRDIIQAYRSGSVEALYGWKAVGEVRLLLRTVSRLYSWRLCRLRGRKQGWSMLFKGLRTGKRHPVLWILQGFSLYKNTGWSKSNASQSSLAEVEGRPEKSLSIGPAG